MASRNQHRKVIVQRPFKSYESLLLGGTDEHINCDNVLTGAPNIASDTKGAISLWVKPTATVPSAVEALISVNDTNAQNFLAISHRNDDGDLLVSAHVGGTTLWQMRTTSPP